MLLRQNLGFHLGFRFLDFYRFIRYQTFKFEYILPHNMQKPCTQWELQPQIWDKGCSYVKILDSILDFRKCSRVSVSHPVGSFSVPFVEQTAEKKVYQTFPSHSWIVLSAASLIVYFVHHKFTIFGITTFITNTAKPTLAWSLVPTNHNHHHHVLRLCADQRTYMLICKPKPTGLKTYIDV